ncbi:hypothetical protein AB205_0079480 [Aquarana catesbeiana]|uniref:EF-hand domain-containing protein n=1 Tax=Aquarana catesbeiana TaxID=8400 RepID=A0A2G9SK72_AQUCT|nr:hypothetical protein AB205_0079480 [Aquarana catesbeiana]
MERKILWACIGILLFHTACLFPMTSHSDHGNDFGSAQFNAEDPHFVIVALPFNFDFYDMNKDGVITLAELSNVTETQIDDANEPFKSADRNGDHLLSEKEFQDAPWVFVIP